ncbi:uncharacterized protein J3R85_014467 [Psidium guajava]|nr:uncharacterized protein J3R85_014467 [Psidium guajava]
MNTRSGCYVRIAAKKLDEMSKSPTREVCDENLSTSNWIDVYICKTRSKWKFSLPQERVTNT